MTRGQDGSLLLILYDSFIHDSTPVYPDAPQTRTVIRYGLEINDPWLPELVRRANAGETVLDNLNLDDTTEDDPSEEKLEALAEMICQGDDGGTKAVALLVLLAALENADDPKSLAKTAKHYAFTRCGEMNVYGMIDVQVAILERELFTHSPHLP